MNYQPQLVSRISSINSRSQVTTQILIIKALHLFETTVFQSHEIHCEKVKNEGNLEILQPWIGRLAMKFGSFNAIQIHFPFQSGLDENFRISKWICLHFILIFFYFLYTISEGRDDFRSSPLDWNLWKLGSFGGSVQRTHHREVPGSGVSAWWPGPAQIRCFWVQMEWALIVDGPVKTVKRNRPNFTGYSTRIPVVGLLRFKLTMVRVIFLIR